MADVDWKLLREKAIEVSARAYAPYSGFPVGAAAVTADDRILVGCNVENVSCGLGLCAECSVACALHSTGGGRLVALVGVDADEGDEASTTGGMQGAGDRTLGAES